MDFVVLDLETTGLDCRKDQVIEIGAVRISHGVLCEEFSTLIKPDGRIPAEITLLTGIDNCMVEGMPSLPQVIPEFKNFLQGSVIVGHNITFDLGFLENYLGDDSSYLDTIEMAKMLLPYEIGYALIDLTVSLKIEHSLKHRALDDAKAAAVLFLYLWKSLKSLDLSVMKILNGLREKKKDPLSDLINQEYSLRMRHFPEERIKAQNLFFLQDKTLGIFGSVPEKEKNESYRINSEEIKGFLQPGGKINHVIPGFQYRSQQEEMAQCVAKSFNEGSNLLVEAGTGTGKSLAYLLPGILWSTNSGHKVIVSTHTINLQEQLMQKDIPLAKDITGIDFSASVIKGRGHYLCIRKWEHYCEENNSEILTLLMRLVLWARNTRTGDINELTLSKKEMGLWQNLAAYSETCFGAKCRYFRGQCFVSRARKLAEQSNLVIVNHSLLLANSMADENILPEYNYLIIDEAHNLEKVAEEQFSLEINYYELQSIFQKLKKNGQQNKGLLETLEIRAGKWTGIDQDQVCGLIQVIKEAEETVAECLSHLTEFFNTVVQIFPMEVSENNLYTQTIRILPQHREENTWPVICTLGENLRIWLIKLIKNLLSLGEKSSMIEAEFGIEIRECHEINVLVTKLHKLTGGLELFLAGNEDEYVSWLEFIGNKHFPFIHISPVDVREQLQEFLFGSKKSVIFTSATLSVEGKFNYFMESTGLDLSDSNLHSLELPSPFNYEEKVMLGIANDLPDPGSSSDILFVDKISKAIIKLILAAKGRTMVLFTSHYQLKLVYENIKIPLKKEGITVYGHGISGNRSKILEEFKNNENSVILGANSFWEGIDVVGEALTLVIIVKLPFWPPTMPTVSARLDRYRSRRINGFRRYSLPQAIIRFRQGFGRLIRSNSDYGVICILDKRVYEKSYGRSFINSVPKIQMQIKKTDELTDVIRDWLVTKGEKEQSFAFLQSEKMIE